MLFDYDGLGWCLGIWGVGIGHWALGIHFSFWCQWKIAVHIIGRPWDSRYVLIPKYPRVWWNWWNRYLKASLEDTQQCFEWVQGWLRKRLMCLEVQRWMNAQSASQPVSQKQSRSDEQGCQNMFSVIPMAFMIIDGRHMVTWFSLSRYLPGLSKYHWNRLRSSWKPSKESASIMASLWASLAGSSPRLTTLGPPM